MFWDNLRTAFQLAARVEEVESHLKELEFEWGDIQEKLLAREERLRKRLSRELKRELEEPVSSPASTPVLALSDERLSAKRAISQRFQQQQAER